MEEELKLWISVGGKAYYYDPVEFMNAINIHYDNLPKSPSLNLNLYQEINNEVVVEFNNWKDNNKTKWYR